MSAPMLRPARRGETSPSSLPTSMPGALREAGSLLRGPLEQALAPRGGYGGVGAVFHRPSVADGVTLAHVLDRRGEPAAVLHVSAPRPSSDAASSPADARGRADLVTSELEAMAAARQALRDPSRGGDGAELTRVLLEPLAVAQGEERTYAVFPRCEPLSDGRLRWIAQRKLLREPLREWLLEVLVRTQRPVDDAAREHAFKAPLERMAADGRFSELVRAHARNALGQLESGAWTPRLSLAHNDLWKGNVLLRPFNAWWEQGPRGTGERAAPCTGRVQAAFRALVDERLVLIDWRGARCDGHPFVDLLRFSRSFRLDGTSLRDEVARHAWALGCAPSDALGYLLAALGEAQGRMGCFAPERYLLMAEQQVRLLHDALGAPPPGLGARVARAFDGGFAGLWPGRSSTPPGRGLARGRGSDGIFNRPGGERA